MQLIDLLSGSGRRNPSTASELRQMIHDSIKTASARIATNNKFLELIDKMGDENVTRLLKFMDGDNPDAPVLKVGPHGPGCECPPENADDVEDDCTTKH